MKYSFYTPIAYDYKFSYAAIMSYYDIADEIILAIDEDRISWAGKKYEFNENEFKEKIKDIDKDKKIKIIESNFHQNIPIQNDTQERNFISKLCTGDYIIGIDSDEILLNSKEFLSWLNNQENLKSDILCTWYTVYKSFGERFLITEPNETTIIGTNLKGYYNKCRFTSRNSAIFKPLLSPLKVLHFSWGRNKEDFVKKLKNWSHTGDFNIDKYITIWDEINLKNYKRHSNLHPLAVKDFWKYLRETNLEEFNLSDKIKEEIKTFSHEHEFFSIVVPIKNQFKIIKSCLESIQRYYLNEDVIIIDDGSTEEETIKFMKFITRQNNWKLIIHKKSLGHTKACEAGIEKAKGKNIFLLNSDTIVTKNSLKILSNYLDANSDVAVVGPSTSSASGPQLIQYAFDNRFRWNNQQIEEFAEEIEKQTGIEDIDLINGFCLGIKKAVFENAGGFDPVLTCYGNEKELLIRIRKAGYRTVYVKGSYVHHYGKMSYSHENINVGQAQIDADRFILKKHGTLK